MPTPPGGEYYDSSFVPTPIGVTPLGASTLNKPNTAQDYGARKVLVKNTPRTRALLIKRQQESGN